MTYKSDSDIPVPYGAYSAQDNSTWTARTNDNRGLIAWVVSNCNAPSKRNAYVEVQRVYLKVSQTAETNAESL